jgi:hypothetical protein
MKRSSAFLPLCRSHLLGFLVAFCAFMMMTDVAAVGAIIPRRLGFWWQGDLLAATPIMCVLGCLIVFLACPVGNGSRYGVVRGIGRIPTLGRYCVFCVIVWVAVLAAVPSLKFLMSFSVDSVKLQGQISDESLMRVMQGVGEGITFRESGGGTQVIFLKEKRAAVERALQKEHIHAY